MHWMNTGPECNLSDPKVKPKLQEIITPLSNDNENIIFNLTECLSSCQKGEFRAEAYTELRTSVK